MISGISIENFKGIRNRVELELRPITLLFGPNSAGKSTIADALDYFAALLRQHSDSFVGVSSRNNERSKFEHLVHNHDLERTIRIGVRFDLSAEDGDCISVPGMTNVAPTSEWGEPTSFLPNLADDLESVTLELEVAGQLADFEGTAISLAQIVGVHVSYNSEHLLSIAPTEARSGTLRGFLWKVNVSNPLIPPDFEHPATIEFQSYHYQLFPLDHNRPLMNGLYGAEKDEQHKPCPGLANYLNALLLAAFRIATDKLQRRRTIGGIRTIPGRNSVFQPDSSPERWHDGSGAWDYLAYCSDNAIDELNFWLGNEKLRTGYQVKRQHLVDVLEYGMARSRINRARNKDTLQAVEHVMVGAERRVGFVPGDNVYDKNVPLLYATEVGTGVSQILPVLVAAIHRSPHFNCIAQPELHLHPRLQTELADVFIYAVNRAANLRQNFYRNTASVRNHFPRFLLETHSEHLVLRLLRRIRETSTGNAPMGCHLESESLAVYYLFQEDSVTNVTMIEADIKGEFIQPWPDDFFELDFYERFN